MKKGSIGIGIIGCGVISRHHARALQDVPGGHLQAVADVSATALEGFQKEFQPPTSYPSAEALLKDPQVQGVILAMPTCHRYKLAKAAFAAGKHVLTEKPVAMSVREARGLIKARGRLLSGCCSSRFLFTSTARHAMECVASGALGKIRRLRVRAVVPAAEPPAAPPPPWRVSKSLNGGGILVNWGCYDLDFMLGVMRWRLVPKHALASVYSVSPHLHDRVAPGSDAETHIVATITFENGTCLQYERAEFYPGPAEACWEITGDNATLQMHMTPLYKPQLVLHQMPSSGQPEETVLWEGPDSPDELMGPAKDFVAAIKERRQPRTTLEHALITAGISEAIYQSAAKGKAVAVLPKGKPAAPGPK